MWALLIVLLGFFSPQNVAAMTMGDIASGVAWEMGCVPGHGGAGACSAEIKILDKIDGELPARAAQIYQSIHAVKAALGLSNVLISVRLNSGGRRYRCRHGDWAPDAEKRRPGDHR